MVSFLSFAFVLFAELEAGMFPAGSPPAHTVDIVDLRNASLDEKLTATTLQGLLNRKHRAHSYLLLAAWDNFWLEYVKERHHVRRTEELPLDEFAARHESAYDRVVIYDPQVPASINVATMYASVENGVVVHPDNDSRLPAEKRRIDLRGRWAANAEAYRWAFQQLWPQMNHRVLACYHPTSCAHHLRDYLVANKVFHFWVSSEEKSGGTVADHVEERRFLEELLAATPVNIPVLGFWYSGEDRGMDEYRGVGLAGEFGKITVVCDWFTNLSFLNGVPADLDHAIRAHRQRLGNRRTPFEPDKVYICFNIVESGDSPSYLQNRQFDVWRDTTRGEVPINWSIGPAVLELAPPIAEYYYEQATQNDYLYVAISGAAYVHPFRDFMARVDRPEDAWRKYLVQTRRYMQQMHCRELGLYTDAWSTYSRKSAEPVLHRFLEQIPEIEQIVLGMGRDQGISPDGASYENGTDGPLISHIMTRWPTDYAARSHEENLNWLEKDIRRHAPARRPGFMQVMALSWAYNPTDIAEVCARLGPNFVPVRLPDFLSLFREATTATSYQ